MELHEITWTKLYNIGYLCSTLIRMYISLRHYGASFAFRNRNHVGAVPFRLKNGLTFHWSETSVMNNRVKECVIYIEYAWNPYVTYTIMNGYLSITELFSTGGWKQPWVAYNVTWSSAVHAFIIMLFTLIHEDPINQLWRAKRYVETMHTQKAAPPNNIK